MPGMTETGAPVVVDFEDLALGGLDTVVVAVTPLPPVPMAQRAPSETIIVPGIDYLRYYILTVTEAE